MEFYNYIVILSDCCIFLENLVVYTLFIKEYGTLCDTIQDIDSLLQYFVTKRIIKIEDSEEFESITKTSDKVKRLLRIIQGPLKSGYTDGFYTMLDIMEEHGVQATKNLAIEIKKCLGIRSTLVF